MISPFDLADDRAYAAWRERKFDTAPRRIEDIVVRLDDPRRLTAAERDALLSAGRKAVLALAAAAKLDDAFQHDYKSLSYAIRQAGD